MLERWRGTNGRAVVHTDVTLMRNTQQEPEEKAGRTPVNDAAGPGMTAKVQNEAEEPVEWQDTDKAEEGGAKEETRELPTSVKEDGATGGDFDVQEKEQLPGEEKTEEITSEKLSEGSAAKGVEQEERQGDNGQLDASDNTTTTISPSRRRLFQFWRKGEGPQNARVVGTEIMSSSSGEELEENGELMEEVQKKDKNGQENAPACKENNQVHQEGPLLADSSDATTASTTSRSQRRLFKFWRKGDSVTGEETLEDQDVAEIPEEQREEILQQIQSQLTPEEQAALVAAATSAPGSTTTTTPTSLVDKMRKGAVAVAGGTLTAVGLVMIPLPTPMGCVVAGSGLSLLATEFEGAKQVQQRCKDTASTTRDNLINTVERTIDSDLDESNKVVDPIQHREDEQEIVIEVNTEGYFDDDTTGTNRYNDDDYFYYEREKQKQTQQKQQQRNALQSYKQQLGLQTRAYLATSVLPLLYKTKREQNSDAQQGNNSVPSV